MPRQRYDLDPERIRYVPTVSAAPDPTPAAQALLGRGIVVEVRGMRLIARRVADGAVLASAGDPSRLVALVSGMWPA